MNYTHLTIEERCCIREFYKKGKSYREITLNTYTHINTKFELENRRKLDKYLN